jgi:hypothetical protein
MTDKLNALLDRLIDSTVLFDDIDLSAVAPEDLIFLLQAMRAWGFMGRGQVIELRETLSSIKTFVSHDQETLIFVGPSRPNIH